MARIEEYTSLEEKSKFFLGEEGMLCGQIDLLFYKLEELNEDGKFLFRGVNNARYKLYSSAQREFLRRELYAIDRFKSPVDKYNEWIKELLIVVKNWNKNSIQNYFESIGITKDDDISYLSFLQHNGFPTPLIDFTLDPFVALFFALEKANYNMGDLGIDSCFSIYFFDKTTYLQQVLNADYKTKSTKNLRKFDDFIQYNYLSIIDHNSISYKVITNMNIVNQKGCFVFNLNGSNPLEVAYPAFIRDLNTPFLKSLKIELKEEKFYCLNIHKSLIPKIRQELFLRKGINTEYIYPNFNFEREYLIDLSITNLLR